MRRMQSGHFLALATGLLAAACSSEVAPTSPAVGADQQGGNSGLVINASSPATYAVIGDVPYGQTALDQFPRLIASINADPDVSRAIHVGDIKSGSTECTDQWFQDIATDFATFDDPLVYSIGDNEWTDCHRVNNGGYVPLDRLAKLRQIFFSDPGHTLGGVQEAIDAQPGYPENHRWEAANVVFATFHIIGSNNGLDEWFTDPSQSGETVAQKVARVQEVNGRVAANLDWLNETFDEAHADGAVGIVLFLHADLWHPADRADGADFSAHTKFVKRLSLLARDFNGPILIISGDSHDYRVDPGVSWFTLYNAKPELNITQIIVDRSLEADAVWLKLTVDPSSPGVFSWDQVSFIPS